VSEIESIFNDLILKTFNYNKFIFTLEKNVNKFYVMSNFLEKWLFNNRGREWDAKRDELQNLIYQHFIPIYKDNTNNQMALLLRTHLPRLETREVGSIPGSGRSSGRGHGNPLQYS
jgi:hypothetical protein